MNQQESVEFAVDYIENLLTFFGINVSVQANLEDDVLEIVVPATEDSSLLIGKGGETLRAFQYQISTVLRNKDAAVVRVNLDIADYKKQRAEKIAEKAREWIEQVRSTGSSHVAHINAADRRIVHQVATEFEDIETFSKGEGRDRSIVIAQKSS